MAEKIIEKVFDSTQVSFKDLERQPTAEELCSLRWIKTPCSYASLGSTFTLLQQDIMLQVSARLQRCINQYYDQMRYKEKVFPKSPFLSEEQKDDVLHIQLDMSDLVSSRSNYKEMFQEYAEGKVPVAEQLSALKMYVKKNNVVDLYPVFDKISLPKKIWKMQDGTEKWAYSGIVDLQINHFIADYAFDLSKGYIPHMARVAKTSKRRVTPRVYLWLMENKDRPKKKKGLDNPLSVSLEELKDFLGCYEINPETKEKVYQYPRYSRFKKDVLDKAKADLIEQAKRNEIDITFDYTEHYLNGKKRGNPDYITFEVFYTPLGKLHKAGKYSEGELFDAKAYDVKKNVQPASSKIETKVGEGTDKWKAFCKLVIGDAEKSLVSRISFIGMKNGRFCVECSDDDFEMIRKLGIEEKAKEFFDCKGSFAPVFYRG